MKPIVAIFVCTSGEREIPILPSHPKQATIRTGFDFYVFFSGVLQFQLVRSLTRRWS